RYVLANRGAHEPARRGAGRLSSGWKTKCRKRAARRGNPLSLNSLTQRFADPYLHLAAVVRVRGRGVVVLELAVRVDVPRGAGAGRAVEGRAARLLANLGAGGLTGGVHEAGRVDRDGARGRLERDVGVRAV